MLEIVQVPSQNCPGWRTRELRNLSALRVLVTGCGLPPQGVILGRVTVGVHVHGQNGFNNPEMGAKRGRCWPSTVKHRASQWTWTHKGVEGIRSLDVPCAVVKEVLPLSMQSWKSTQTGMQFLLSKSMDDHVSSTAQGKQDEDTSSRVRKTLYLLIAIQCHGIYYYVRLPNNLLW